MGMLGELLTSANLPQDFREGWAFSACMALAVQLAHTAPVSSAGMQPALMPTTSDARCSGASPLHPTRSLFARFLTSVKAHAGNCYTALSVPVQGEHLKARSPSYLTLPCRLQQPAQLWKDSSGADWQAHRQVPERW